MRTHGVVLPCKGAKSHALPENGDGIIPKLWGVGVTAFWRGIRGNHSGTFEPFTPSCLLDLYRHGGPLVYEPQ